MSSSKRFCRSKNNSMICGVCSGLAEYFNVDPNLVRLIFVFAFLIAPILILGYLIACLLIPQRNEKGECETPTLGLGHDTETARLVLIVLGVVLISVGILLVIPGLSNISFIASPLNLIRERGEAVMLIIVGATLLALGLIVIERTRNVVPAQGSGGTGSVG
ncbi:MAG: PspC domain-containing protein [Ignisphaera sp.]